MLKIQRIQSTPKTWVLSLQGSVDSSNVADLQDAIDTAFQNNIHRLVIDLARVEFVASSGFGCFLTSRDQAIENGGDLGFSAARVQVREIFNLMGLDQLLLFFPDVTAALQHFSKATPASSGRRT
jgi:anti-sigma B factor antagonist